MIDRFPSLGFAAFPEHEPKTWQIANLFIPGNQTKPNFKEKTGSSWIKVSRAIWGDPINDNL